MKKTLLVLLLLACASYEIDAQHFTASFGVEHNWGIPSHVSRVIYNSYYGYDWVHASRVHRRGSVFFDLVLQRGDVFIEVSVRNDGYVSRRVYRENYPLHDHVCNNYCGYHNSYYKTYYRDCHSSHHHGHNHVVYINRPHGHAYGHNKKSYYKSTGYEEYRYYSEPKGNGYYKEHNKFDHRYDKSKSHTRTQRSDSDRQRRDSYHMSKKNEQGRGNHKYKDKGSYKDRDKGRGKDHERKSRGASYVSRRN